MKWHAIASTLKCIIKYNHVLLFNLIYEQYGFLIRKLKRKVLRKWFARVKGTDKTILFVLQ